MTEKVAPLEKSSAERCPGVIMKLKGKIFIVWFETFIVMSYFLVQKHF